MPVAAMPVLRLAVPTPKSTLMSVCAFSGAARAMNAAITIHPGMWQTHSPLDRRADTVVGFIAIAISPPFRHLPFAICHSQLQLRRPPLFPPTDSARNGLMPDPLP